jgi:transposase InsO family protein
MGVSRACAHRWVARFDVEGWDGLHDRSSRPHACPTRTGPAAEQAVLTARAQTRRGPAEIARRTGVPERTVTRVLRRHGMPRLAQLDPVTGVVIRASKSTAVRYERDRPGDLIHMDVKKIGRIPDGGGWKAHGRQMGRTSVQKKARIGFDYIHSAIDDHSRLSYSEVLSDEKGDTCGAFLARAIAWFTSMGVPAIREVMTDNHWSYTRSNKVAEAIAAVGAKHVTIRPHCPWQNGKVERYQRTLATEWAYATTYLTNDQRTAALPTWQQTYNTERAHTALGGRPPISRVVSRT